MANGVAGYNGRLYLTGTSTAMVDEPTTEVSGTVFQITSTAKRILDADVAVVVKVNAVIQTSGYTVDYNLGKITFATSQTLKTVTVTASYLPRHLVALVRSTEISLTWDTGDSTVQGNEGQDITLTLQRVAVTVDAVQVLDEDLYGTTSPDEMFAAGNVVVVEVQSTGPTNNVWRARSLASQLGLTNGGPAGLVGSTLNFVGSSGAGTLLSVGPV